MEQQPTKRNHSIDALRVSAFGLLMLYHLGMGYVSDWGWHIKSAFLTDALHIPMLWSNQWRMSLLFLISGFALAEMMQNKPVGLAIKQRLIVLGLPLLAGIFLWIVPQVYVELAHQGTLQNMGVGEFLIRYWHPLQELPDGYGRLLPTTWTWNHLWFLPYVMSYCALYIFGVAVVGYIKRRFEFRLAHLKAPKPLGIALIFILPCFVYWQIGAWLYQHFPTTHAFYNDWFNHASYYLSFLIGAWLAHSPVLLKQLARYWLPALILASAMFVMVVCLYTRAAFTDWHSHLQGLIWSSNRWLWQLAVIALAMRFVNDSPQWVIFFKPRIFCYYIFHQTWLVLTIYLLSPMRLGAFEAIYVLMITAVSCEVSYQLAVRLGRFGLALGVVNGLRRLGTHIKGSNL